MEALKIENLKSIDWHEILAKLESFATSEQARDELKCLGPLSSIENAERTCAEIFDAQALLAAGERPFMESLDLYSTWFHRLKREAVLQTLELKDVRRFCHEVVALHEVMRPLNNAWVSHIRSQLMDATAPLSAIDQIMTPTGEIRSDASPTLNSLHKEKGHQTRALQNVLDRLVHDHQMEPLLQERYVTTREGRWVLPVKGGMQHAFPGIIHGSSQSKQTVFMEPEEVIPLNNRLRQIDVEIDNEIERILTELSIYLHSLCFDFEKAAHLLLKVDIRLSQAKLAQVLEAIPPRFHSGKMELIEVRHPLLVLRNMPVVTNDVEMNFEKRVLVLSGPNAGGKTVLLKSIGLAAHMARCGLPICCEEGSTLPFFRNILVGVGDSQSVDAQLSTFAAHIQILNQAIQLQGPENLILLDEICGSTDPEEGSALARSFIEAYAKNQTFSVITSHLGPLKTGWTEDSGVINGSLEYNSQTGLPTYRFLMGVAGQSLAIQTARRVGVADSILNRALDFLSPEAKLQHRHLTEIEALKDELHTLKENVMSEARSAREAKRHYKELIALFRKERDQWLDRAIKKAEKKIDDLIGQSQVDSIFKRHERLQQIKFDLPEIMKPQNSSGSDNGSGSGSNSPGSVRKRIETVEEFEKVFPPGSSVFVPSIAQEGIVQGKANGKGEIAVLSNSMRLMVHWQSLKPSQNIHNPTGQIIRRSSGVQVTIQDSERVVDLRGQRVDEAIGILENALDSASAAHEDRIKIIHGHGTETLKKSIRAHLSRSVYVKKWQAGTPELGGDGITWVHL